MGRQLIQFVDSQLKFDSKLVKCVKQNEHLYDRDHKLFNDTGTRIETWKNIGEILERTDSYCEERWLYIVNRLYDEILWSLQYKTPPPWLLFPQIEFLVNYIDIEDLLGSEVMDYDAVVSFDGL